MLKNKESDKVCYILLGGLSAKNLDLSFFSEKDVITANFFFKTEENLIVKPKYHLIIDPDFYKDKKNVDDLKREGLKKTTFFLNGRYYKGDVKDNIKIIYPLLRVAGDNIKCSLDSITTNFSTVTFSCIQTAIYLGYKEINLVGFDLPPGHMPHFYKDSEAEKRAEIEQKEKSDEYEYCSLFWQYTNCHHESYKIKKLADDKSVSIYNMSPISFVRSFPYKEFSYD